jgi:hypothetical protein
MDSSRTIRTYFTSPKRERGRPALARFEVARVCYPEGVAAQSPGSHRAPWGAASPTTPDSLPQRGCITADGNGDATPLGSNRGGGPVTGGARRDPRLRDPTPSGYGVTRSRYRGCATRPPAARSNPFGVRGGTVRDSSSATAKRARRAGFETASPARSAREGRPHESPAQPAQTHAAATASSLSDSIF